MNIDHCYKTILTIVITIVYILTSLNVPFSTKLFIHWSPHSSGPRMKRDEINRRALPHWTWNVITKYFGAHLSVVCFLYERECIIFLSSLIFLYLLFPYSFFLFFFFNILRLVHDEFAVRPLSKKDKR